MKRILLIARREYGAYAKTVGFWLSRFRAIVRSPRARLAAGAAVCIFGIYGLVLFGHGLLGGSDPHAHHHHAVDAGGVAGDHRI
jgi:hypothetical protein